MSDPYQGEEAFWKYLKGYDKVVHNVFRSQGITVSEIMQMSFYSIVDMWMMGPVRTAHLLVVLEMFKFHPVWKDQFLRFDDCRIEYYTLVPKEEVRKDAEREMSLE